MVILPIEHATPSTPCTSSSDRVEPVVDGRLRWKRRHATGWPIAVAHARDCDRVYILPNAVSLNDWAFGDEAIVIYTHERMHWVNADGLVHRIVADSPDATDFRNTDELHPNGGEQFFTMTKKGTTGIHCAIHPNMTGTLIVREK